jgi:hypothetical protein
MIPEVLATEQIKIKGFWDMMLCSFEDRYQHFKGTMLLHKAITWSLRLHSRRIYLKMKSQDSLKRNISTRLHQVTPQKAIILISTVVYSLQL